MRNAGLASLAFYYCDFKEDHKKTLRNMLSSLLLQLCDQSDPYLTILSDFYSAHGRGTQGPSDRALAQCLNNMLTFPAQAPIYIIIDALDECPSTSAMPSPRECLSSALSNHVFRICGYASQAAPRQMSAFS